MRAIRFALIAACLFAASAAEAGWQETRWNMSPRRVEQVMKGAAPRGAGDPSRDALRGKEIGNVGHYSLGDARFGAVYCYDWRGLARIGLYREAGDCDAIIASLIALHGQPYSDAPQPGMRAIVWHDRPARNRVRLLIFTTICDIAYERRRDFEAGDQAGRIRL